MMSSECSDTLEAQLSGKGKALLERGSEADSRRREQRGRETLSRHNRFKRRMEQG